MGTTSQTEASRIHCRVYPVTMESPIDNLPPEVMRRVLVWLGCTSCTTIVLLQLVARGWRHAADNEMWRALLLELCGRDIVDLIATLNQIRTTKTYHRDLCLNLAFFGNEAIVVDLGRGYAKFGRAGIESLLNPTPEVLQICQPNAETDLYDLLDDVAQRVNSAILASTLVVTVPFGLAGADHYTIRRQLQNLPQLAHCKAVYFVDAALSVLLAHGFVTGCVCSIGFGQTFVVPVIDGKVIEEGVLTSRMGGMALTQRMQGLVIDEVEEEIDLNHLQMALDLPLVTYCRNLKEQYCHVLPRPMQDNSHCDCNHVIPVGYHGHTVMQLKLRHACHACPEMLFEGSAGLGPMICQSIASAAEAMPDRPDAQSVLLKSIVMNGGSAQMPGLAERVAYEVERLLPEEEAEAVVSPRSPRLSPRTAVPRPARVKVCGGEWGDHAPWRGAARLALATPSIHSPTSLPQSLVIHQCGADGCNETESSTGSLKLCTRCKNIRYCCAEHQKEHWREHKAECSDPAEVAARLAAQAEQEMAAEKQQLLEEQQALEKASELLEALEKQQAEQEELQRVQQLIEEQHAELEAELQAAEEEDGASDAAEAADEAAMDAALEAAEAEAEALDGALDAALDADSSNSTEVVPASSHGGLGGLNWRTWDSNGFGLHL